MLQTWHNFSSVLKTLERCPSCAPLSCWGVTSSERVPFGLNCIIFPFVQVLRNTAASVWAPLPAPAGAFSPFVSSFSPLRARRFRSCVLQGSASESVGLETVSVCALRCTRWTHTRTPTHHAGGETRAGFNYLSRLATRCASIVRIEGDCAATGGCRCADLSC